MIEQAILYGITAVLGWIGGWDLPAEIWSAFGQLSRGIATLIDWTPAIPYVPYQALYLGVMGYLSVYGVLVVLAFVNFILEWVRGK